MKRISLLLLAAAGLPLLVHAQSARSPAAATDANAAVPALQYESVFAARPASPAPQATPDLVWLKANQALAGGAEHGAHGMHGMHGMHGAETAPVPTQTPAPAAPAAPKAAPADDPHKGHHMNMKGH